MAGNMQTNIGTNGRVVYVSTVYSKKPLVKGDKLYTTPPAAPVAWKWHQAPVKTSWGHDMVVADLAIDKDNTVSVYCERDQTTKVEAMFTSPAAQRQSARSAWVGLTDELRAGAEPMFFCGAKWAERILREKNSV
jgi:hypothetical protein